MPADPASPKQDRQIFAWIVFYAWMVLVGLTMGAVFVILTGALFGVTLYGLDQAGYQLPGFLITLMGLTFLIICLYPVKVLEQRTHFMARLCYIFKPKSRETKPNRKA